MVRLFKFFLFIVLSSTCITARSQNTHHYRLAGKAAFNLGIYLKTGNTPPTFSTSLNIDEYASEKFAFGLGVEYYNSAALYRLFSDNNYAVGYNYNYGYKDAVFLKLRLTRASHVSDRFRILNRFSIGYNSYQIDVVSYNFYYQNHKSMSLNYISLSYEPVLSYFITPSFMLNLSFGSINWEKKIQPVSGFYNVHVGFTTMVDPSVTFLF